MTFSNSPSSGVALQGGGGSGGAGASAPLTGTGAIVTTSQPLIDVSQTWNNAAVTFTSLKLNITDTASNAASLLMDLQVGGASRFSVRKDGSVIAPLGSAATPSLGMGTGSSGLYSRSATLRLNFAISGADAGVEIGPALLALQNTAAISWTSATLPSSSSDTFLTRRGAANLRLGAADAASAVPQLLSVQSVVAGTTNTAGQNFTITGSQGTGTGAGGSLIFQVAPAGSSGSAQNALQNVFLLPGLAGEARLVNAVGGSADFKICSTSNTNVHLTIKHGTDASGASGTTTGFIGRISSSFGFFDGGGSLIFGQPSGSTDSISIWGTDCRIARDAANTLALRNGTAAQEFRVYETTTGTIYKAILGNRQLMKIAGAAFDNGAGANAGTLANSPVTGNPTKWIPIDDNGTTRYIPAW